MRKQTLAIVGLAATLLVTPINVRANGNINNMLHGEITRKQYDDSNYVVEVTINRAQEYKKDVKYAGHKYLIAVSKKWYKSVKRGNKVTITLDTNGTKSVKDDEAIEIRKGYWWEWNDEVYRYDDSGDINW